MEKLISKIKDHEAIIGIIGLGYVGLPLSIRFSEENFPVIGFDIDKKKVKLLSEGKSYIKHVKKDNIMAMAKNGFTATSDFRKITEVDVIIICVPTPLGNHNEPDLSYIFGTLDSIKPYLIQGQLLILESTSYPGTTEEILVPFIESIFNSSLNTNRPSLFTIGENYFLGYSPEREDPGNQNFPTKTIPKVVSGHSKYCLQLTEILYDQIVDQTVSVSSPKVAEMTKIMENIHRAVNIGLVNELKIVADKMGIDMYEVISAAATKPFGFTPYYPGPGLGGHCIPIDPFYFTWKARELGMNTRFIELAGEINTKMPEYVFRKANEALNQISKSVNGSDILILGLGYKKNIDDTRESPSFAIIDLLLKSGANIKYSDPFLDKIPKTRKYNFDFTSIKLDKKNIASFDLIILATDHDEFDYDKIEKYGQIIVDTRGRFKNGPKIVRA